MGRIRVVITRRGHLDVRDGINIFIFALANELRRTGNDVAVVATTAGDHGRLKHLFDMEDLPVLQAVERGPPRVTAKGLSLGWLTRGRALIDEFQPDLVINNGVLPFKPRGTSLGLSHDMGWRTSQQRFGAVRRLYKRYGYGRCDKVVAMCSEVRLALSRELSIELDSIHLMPPAVDVPDPPAGSAANREDAILHAGTADYKNPAATVRAFGLLGQGSTRLYLEGPANATVEREVMELPVGARRRVELLGELGAVDLRRLHRSVRVASFPTRYTVPTASATVVEAIAERTPLVGSTLISEDVLVDNANGLVARDDAARAKAFRALLADDELWARLSRGAACLAPSFAVERAARQFLALSS
ncbi:hypothetical protein BH23CHL7_BH23CHL7_06340 [soil metagenome]